MERVLANVIFTHSQSLSLSERTGSSPSRRTGAAAAAAAETGARASPQTLHNSFSIGTSNATSSAQSVIKSDSSTRFRERLLHVLQPRPWCLHIPAVSEILRKKNKLAWS
ncbi:hypothetical protein QQF64_021599 [Cirrhinus molitorella]|uniref:Uncharacterized protein n=1 Tax=Cirrhinus molitorella TaxID=172907 RepID=A0ABR3L841_9TELE